MTDIFVTKYKPRISKDIIGDTYSLLQIKKWLNNFNNERFKCLLITGNHGVGKSSRINVILNDLGYTIKNLNIISFKQATNQHTYLCNLTVSKNIIDILNFQKDKKVAILIDELDVEALTQEKTQLITLMKMNNDIVYCPVIFVFDAKHSKLINTLRKGVCEIKIPDPTNEDMMVLTRQICHAENMHIKNIEVANEIIKFCQNDYRRLCMTLCDISREYTNEQITIDKVMDYISSMKEKDTSMGLFKSSQMLLSHYKSIDDCLKLYQVEKVNIPLMIHQYYIDTIANNAYRHDTNFESITNALSFGDVIDNYIYGEQRWDLTNVHGFYSCGLPSYLLKNLRAPFIRYEFPKDMNRTSTKKQNKKHIIDASKKFNSLDPLDYIYLGKILSDLLTNYDNDVDAKSANESIIKIMRNYKLHLDDIENIIKIDKNIQDKFSLSAKQKRLLREI